MKKGHFTPLFIVALLTAGLLAGCGTANRGFDVNQHNGRYNVNDYDGRIRNYDGLNNLNNRYSPYYTNRTNIYGLTDNRTNIYDAYYPQNTFDSDYLRDRNMTILPNNRIGTTTTR